MGYSPLSKNGTQKVARLMTVALFEQTGIGSFPALSAPLPV